MGSPGGTVQASVSVESCGVEGRDLLAKGTTYDEKLAAKVRASFLDHRMNPICCILGPLRPRLAIDRTYGARRVCHDVLADGVSCGLHRIERLMRACEYGRDGVDGRPIWVSGRPLKARHQFHVRRIPDLIDRRHACEVVAAVDEDARVAREGRGI